MEVENSGDDGNSGTPDWSIEDEIDDSELNELEAVFSINSSKIANGVEQIRDNNLETYWQSDGYSPHLINIQFLKRVPVTKLCIYLKYGIDESYTPKKISVHSGITTNELNELMSIELEEPHGWLVINLYQHDHELGLKTTLYTHFLQVRILTMHQSGRDTHVRQVKVFGPRIPVMGVADTKISDFVTEDMFQFSQLR